MFCRYSDPAAILDNRAAVTMGVEREAGVLAE